MIYLTFVLTFLYVSIISDKISGSCLLKQEPLNSNLLYFNNLFIKKKQELNCILQMILFILTQKKWWIII